MAEKFLLEMAETIKASIPGNNIQIEDQENKAVISGDMECGIKGINVSIECSTSTIKIKGAREYKYPITEASKDIFQQEMIKKYRMLSRKERDSILLIMDNYIDRMEK